jgi:hypothetical protein
MRRSSVRRRSQSRVYSTQRLLLACLFLAQSLTWTGCATGPRTAATEKWPPLTDLSHYHDPEAIQAFTAQIQSLTQRLRASSTPVTGADYQEILNELTSIVRDYKAFMQDSQIASIDDLALHIPAQSKVTMEFKTYCLTPHGAAPEEDEAYVLTHKDPGIPFFAEVMAYTNRHNEVTQSQKQSLLWNLKNQVKFEDLPADQQALLLKITPTAYLRLNNALKTMAMDHLKGLIEQYVPAAGQMQDAYQLIQGRAYPYEEYARSIERLRSHLAKPAVNAPLAADGYDLYTLVKAHGFSSATITFFNAGASPQIVHSYFKPLRSDVQPLAFDIPALADLYSGLKAAFGDLIIAIAKSTDHKIQPGEQLTLEEHADSLVALWKGYGDRTNAIATTERLFGSSGQDDASDAFRHAYWNALMVRDVGETMAVDIATNHELNPGSSESRQMDLWNNEVGRQIGKRLIGAGVKNDAAYAQEVQNNKSRLKVLK